MQNKSFFLKHIDQKEIAIVAFLAIFYVNIFYQNIKPNNLNTYESKATNVVLADSNKTDDTDNGAKRALIAIQESKSNVVESKKGCNCGERVDQYTQGLHQQWCAMFVSWVLNQSGRPLKGPDEKVPWRITNARKIAEYLKNNGTWTSKEEAIQNNIQPKVGDIMIFWRGNFEGNLGHADIVVGLDPKVPGHASLVGGNLYDKVLYRESYYYADYYGLLGFGRPEKPSDVESKIKRSPETTPEQKEETIQETPKDKNLRFLFKPS